MADIAKSVYEQTAIGSIGWIRPEGNSVDKLEEFKSEVMAVTVMEEYRLILVKKLHRENQTGQKFIDAIQFVKVK